MTHKLFTPLTLGPLTLRHRVVMAPLTRMRASPDGNVPTALNALYYAQRATPGGLLIAEATPVSWQGHGHPNVPGHPHGRAGRRLAARDRCGACARRLHLLQLWHTGRVSHSSHQPDGVRAGRPVGHRGAGHDPRRRTGRACPMKCRARWRLAEMPALVDSWRQAAAHAMQAGFDGVEIHGANGYLLEQFLQSRSNTRTDRYGGSIENRCRLHLEIAAAVAQEVGAERTGIRLSPWGIANDSGEAEPLPLYTHLVRELARLKLAYLHLIEPRASGTGKADIFREGQPSAAPTFRPLWPTVLIDAGGFDRDGAIQAVEDGRADAVAFGRYFISNPDLPRRLQTGAALTPLLPAHLLWRRRGRLHRLPGAGRAAGLIWFSIEGLGANDSRRHFAVGFGAGSSDSRRLGAAGQVRRIVTAPASSCRSRVVRARDWCTLEAVERQSPARQGRFPSGALPSNSFLGSSICGTRPYAIRSHLRPA